MLWAGFIVGWIICGVLAYGLILANLQRSWPILAETGYRADCAVALFVSISSPFCLLVALLCSGFGKYGLMWRRP